MDSRNLLLDAALIATEVAALAIAVALIAWIWSGLMSRLADLPSLAGRRERLGAVRRGVRTALILLGVLLALALIGAQGVLLYRGIDLLAFTRDWLQGLPPGLGSRIGLGLLQVAVLAGAAAVLLRLLRRLLAAVEERAKAYQQIHANDESIEAFFDSLRRILTNTAWLLVLALSARVVGLPAAATEVLDALWKIYLAIAVGLLVVKAIDAVIDSLDALSMKYSSPRNLLRYYDRLRELLPLGKRCLEYVIYIYVATFVVLQVKPISGLAEHGPRIVRIIGIFFLSRVVIELVNLVVEELLLKRRDLSPAKRAQRLTFVPLIRSVLKYAIYFGAAILILSELGINPAPILAGAGIVGLAVGLGAQNLVNDFVSGFFILFENHFLVGDFIETGDARGVVEAIDIRTTRVRDPSGQLHILRNGQIGSVVNYSKDYTRAVVEVGVAYESDLGHVEQVLQRVGEELAAENPDVLEPTVIQGLEEFGASELLMRTATRVKPGAHMQVGRDLRRRIKRAFDEHGIEIPYARRVLIVKDEEGVKRLNDALRPTAGDPTPPGTADEGGSAT